MDRSSLETSHERELECLVDDVPKVEFNDGKIDESRFDTVLNELIFILHEKRRKYIGDGNIEGVIAANSDIKYLQDVIYPAHRTC